MQPVTEMRTLGRTGVEVSPLCLGAMMFGAWGNTDHDESVRIIHAALDAGINVVDTADVYSAGRARRSSARRWPGDGGTTSSWPPYWMLVRGIERELLPVTQEYGMGTLVWGPLAGGWLSGTWRKGAGVPEAHRASAMGGRMAGRYDLSDPVNRRKLDAADALAEVAEQAGLIPPQLAIAFTIRHPGVTSSIIGPRTMEQLTSQLPAVDVVLSDDVLDAIDAIAAPGTNMRADDAGYAPPVITDASLRRR